MQINADRLCLYGIPDASLRKELTAWLEKDARRAVCILHEEEYAQVGHERIRTYCLGGLEMESLLNQIAWEGVFLSWSYLGEHALLEKLKAKQQEVHLFASDFADRGLQVTRNLLQNLSQMKEIYRARDMKNCFRNQPAIICGAGASLEKAADSLREMQALIFSGGAGLKALEKFGLQAHFAGAIDPYPAVQRLQLQNPHLPVFFQGRVASDLLGEMKGQKIWVEPSGHFPLEEWFAEEMGGGTFDGGWNVATFLTALAVHLGCDPIILVGVDLQGEYAGGVVRAEGEKRDWAIAKEWLDAFMAKHPQVHFWPYELPACEIDPTISAPKFQPDIESCRQKFVASVNRVKKACDELLQKEDFLLKFELEEEIAYQVWCKPVWDVWQHVFKREVFDERALEINKWLFMRGMCNAL